MKANEIVKKLRDYDEELFNYKLPDESDQLFFIQEQLDACINIFVVNAPVIITTDNTTISIKSWNVGNKIDVPKGTRTILMYGWFDLSGLLDTDGNVAFDQGQLFRGYFSEKDIKIDNNFLK